MKKSAKEYVDTIIIGAGTSGLFLSNFLSKQKQESLCLEAHTLPGGCSGFYVKNGQAFDVGATTLSGMAYNGPLQRFIEQVELDINLLPVDSGITISKNGLVINRYRDSNKWISHIEELFPHSHMRDFWTSIDVISELAWKHTEALRYFPPRKSIRGGSDCFHLATSSPFEKVKLLRSIFYSFYDVYLKKHNFNASFLDILNELMLIATQNNLHRTPALFGVLGLSYAGDLWYPYGGMGNFSKQLLRKSRSNGGEFRFNSKVVKVERVKDFFEVSTQKKTYRCKSLVSTLDLWSTHKISQSLNPYLLVKDLSRNSPKWGAITGYFSIKLKGYDKDLYHQVHLEKPLSFCSPHSLFFSLCPSDDDLRVTNEGYRTLSVSTHIDVKRYFEVLNEMGEAKLKAQWRNEITDYIKEYFSSNLLDLLNQGIGDPTTFYKYTSRFQGSVGGIPQSLEMTPLTYPKQSTGVKNFYHIGDTTFPGQGVVGVLMGAEALYHRQFNK